MTEFVERLASATGPLRTRAASLADRSARIARRSRGAVTARAVETRIPASMRPRSDDGFIAAVHFAGDADSAYQLEQWLVPLEGLARHLREKWGVKKPVGILCRSADHALQIAEQTSLPVRFSRLAAGLTTFMTQPDLKIVFYVNQSMKNFQALRFPAPAHIHLSHGESEKISMISNQLKAYDWVFAAGPAARKRIVDTLIGMPESKLMDVGRPQLDEPRSVPLAWSDSSVGRGSGPVVFVAPTWEGDSPSMAYGTVDVSGLPLLESLVGEGFRVIYRPHPRTGVASQAARRARTECEQFISAHPAGFLDTTSSVGWQLDVADAAVCEMSSVAFDWLSTGRPLVMVRPADQRAETLDGGLFDRAPSYLPVDVGDVGPYLRELFEQSNWTVGNELAEHYLGPTGPGRQQSRFEDAAQWAIRLRTERKA